VSRFERIVCYPHSMSPTSTSSLAVTLRMLVDKMVGEHLDCFLRFSLGSLRIEKAERQQGKRGLNGLHCTRHHLLSRPSSCTSFIHAALTGLVRAFTNPK
jgi:hypothetical protein